jgi:hypothetical protein
MGVLLWRGFGLDNVMAQCFGTEEDTSGKGRQMPVVSTFQSLLNVLSQLGPSPRPLALWLYKASFPHNIVATRDTDSSSGRSGLRSPPNTLPTPSFHRSMLFWRRRSIRR